MQDFDAAGIANATARTEWVEGIVSEAVSLGTDGANVDIEGFKGQKDDLNKLIAELAKEFRAKIPTAQVTFDTAVYPSDEPSYDYTTLAKHLDFFVPMACARHPLPTPVAPEVLWALTRVFTDDMVQPPHQLANCPFDGLNKSVAGYASYGVKPHQIVYGLPWYGYDFPCSDATPGAPCEPSCPDGRESCPQVDYKEVVQCRLAGGSAPVSPATRTVCHRAV